VDDQANTVQPPVSRELITLQKGKLSTDLRLPGELIAYQQVDLYAKVNSFVSRMYADIGSQVKTGQLLVTMEAPELSSQLAGAKSKLKSQEAVFLASRANYLRLYETSQTPGTVAQNDLDLALSKKDSDSAQLEAARSAYDEIADTRNYLEIRAPFDGIISARNVNLGAYVGPSGKGSELPIFTLQEQKKLRLVISVPEAYTGYVSQNARIGFQVKTFPNKTFSARVNRLAGALDDRLRSERIEMDVVNNDKELLPGMVAEVVLPLTPTDSSFIVPKTAYVNSTERSFVIKVVDGKAHWVDVKKGREIADRVEVFGNLSEGDQLVKAASEEVRDGSVVGHATLAN
jgi:RND family efflux transporter MFP subunit